MPYLFRLRLTLNVQRALQRAMQQSDWKDAGQGWQGKETTLRLQGWSRQRRTILLRRKKDRDRTASKRADTEQLLLGFGVTEADNELWEYTRPGHLAAR